METTVTRTVYIQIKLYRHTQHTYVLCIGTDTILMTRSSRGIRRVHKTSLGIAEHELDHKPVIAIFADHLLVPSKTDCSTAIMWPMCAFSSTPKTDLNSDETLFHKLCQRPRSRLFISLWNISLFRDYLYLK